MNSHRRLRHLRTDAPAAPLQPELLFCAVCQVSIAEAELESGVARRTPRGRIFCGTCATSSPDERARRRAALEEEFADDAPVIMPVAPAPLPVVAPRAPSGEAEVPVLDLRVGELERAAFRLQARVSRLEERLDAALRRLE